MKDGNDPLVCGEDVLEKYLRRVRCVGKGYNSRRKEIGFVQLIGVENVERTDHIGNLSLVACGSGIISQQRFTSALKFPVVIYYSGRKREAFRNSPCAAVISNPLALSFFSLARIDNQTAFPYKNAKESLRNR